MKLLKKIYTTIKQKLLVDRDFVKYINDDRSELIVNDYHKLFATSFGEANPDKIFYIIRRNSGGAGFFSNLTHVLVNIKYAEDLGMIPIVDFENFKTFYNEETLIENSHNAWEYYFEQISPYTLQEVYTSKHVFFSDGIFHWEHWEKNLRNKEFYQKYFNKYIKILPKVLENLMSYQYFFENRVLAVHFRGKEMNYAPSHFFAPTIEQMFKYTDIMMDKYKLDKIFLVTEEKLYLDIFIKRYGDKVLFTDSFCVAKVNAYNLYPRECHKYLLGFEILRDVLLMSKCNAILCSSSNVSEVAKFIGDHEVSYFIDNGKNSDSAVIARVLYDIKKVLPKCLGGLKDNIVKEYKSM